MESKNLIKKTITKNNIMVKLDTIIKLAAIKLKNNLSTNLNY